MSGKKNALLKINLPPEARFVETKKSTRTTIVTEKLK